MKTGIMRTDTVIASCPGRALVSPYLPYCHSFLRVKVLFSSYNTAKKVLCPGLDRTATLLPYKTPEEWGLFAGKAFGIIGMVPS